MRAIKRSFLDTLTSCPQARMNEYSNGFLGFAFAFFWLSLAPFSGSQDITRLAALDRRADDAALLHIVSISRAATRETDAQTPLQKRDRCLIQPPPPNRRPSSYHYVIRHQLIRPSSSSPAFASSSSASQKATCDPAPGQCCCAAAHNHTPPPSLRVRHPADAAANRARGPT